MWITVRPNRIGAYGLRTAYGGKYHLGTLFRTTLSGVLYGRTGGGGSIGNGTIFTVTPSGRRDVIYNFRRGSGEPNTFMLLNDGLYGTLEKGYGGIFRLTR